MVDRVKRTRLRRRAFTFDREEVVTRVLHFFQVDDDARAQEKEARIQRYAKYRMWTEGKDWPFEDSSDLALPDMTEKSLKIQDTLHNAVMSFRPPVGANAIDRTDAKKEKVIDKLIDCQVFDEQDGENTIGDLSDAFTNDGVMTAFVPWVKEMREVSDARMFPKIPRGMLPIDYFAALIDKQFPGAGAIPVPGSDAFDWKIFQDGKRFEIAFYTKDARNDGRVEMVVRREVEVFNGPRIIQKEWDDVVYPARAANLRIPGPSNPHGASHVILVDYPTVDEIKRLKKSGVYDLLTEDDLDTLTVVAGDTKNQEAREAKDAFQGVDGSAEPSKTIAGSHRTLTRYLCFDTFDIDGDGVDEDVVWWVIKDIKALARAKLLTEVFPSNPPRRPLAGSSFIPVRGRYGGISQLEILEGLHDAIKTTLDQAVDSGTIKNAPFFFYRPTGAMKPEIIRLSPGEGYPLNDPQKDIHFPQFNNQDQVFHLNMVTLLTQMEEKVTLIGGLQSGQVPQGKASALRTVGGMSLIFSQGESRPERILRRFFMGLTEIWSIIHEANQNFLPEKKKIRVIGLLKPSDDPYITIDNPSDISGRFEFSFKANIMNTSKAGLQQSIQAVMGAYITELSLQLGIIDGEGIYELMRKFGFAWGFDPDSVLKAPSPDSMKTRMFAEEVISSIMDGEIPDGRPAEPGGWIAHLEVLQGFLGDEKFGFFSPGQVDVFKAYFQKAAEQASIQQQQMAQQAAAGQFGQPMGGQPGRPAGPPENPQGNPPIESGELLDETLPGAGGGANPGLGLS